MSKEPLALITLQGVWMCYPGTTANSASLADINLEITPGESVAVVGRSGSGKSTLLNILAALISPTSGRYLYNGEAVEMDRANSPSAIRLRRRAGYVSQGSDLIGNFSVLGNVKLAAACRQRRIKDDEALHWLEKVGLKDRSRAKPSELSGGERQRVNIARAMLCKPEILLADEPTGALDPHTSRHVLGLMHELTGKTATTLILVTHVPEYAAECARQLFLNAGRVHHDERGLAIDTLRRFIAGDPQ